MEDFANTMALRTGGLSGVQKLIDSKALGSIELSTGIQISGQFNSVIDYNGKPIYLRTVGPTALSYREKELVGHGAEQHPEGFGSPIGELKGINIAIEDMSARVLKAYKIYEGEQVSLEFEGAVTVEGTIVTGTRNLQGKIILITFKDCKVTHDGTLLFLPNWGLYHMAIGQEVVSAFNGPADLNSFDLITHELTATTIKSKKSKERAQLEVYYKQIREFREGTNTTISRHKVFQEIKKEHPNDWLLPTELYELAKKSEDVDFQKEIMEHLETVKQNNPKVGHLIDDGLGLVDHSFSHSL